MKDVELRLISELMKNSRRSDRELSRALKVSQPTVSRVRTRLETEGYLKEFTTIPDFAKLGFQLVAVILVKLKMNLTEEEIEKARQITMKDIMEKAPDQIVLFNRGIGGGYTGVLVSFHKDYSDYSRLIAKMKEYPFIDLSATLSFLVDVNDKVQYRPFTFSTLAKYLLTMQKQEKA